MEWNLTEADDGAALEAAPGDALVVRLNENPTTGYRWSLDALEGDVVTLGADEFERSEGAGVGGGGKRILTFSALRPGSADIGLTLRRRWEGDDSALERVRLSVRVVADR